jgi:hypothetical protein
MESDCNITCFSTKYILSTNPSRSAADSEKEIGVTLVLCVINLHYSQ